MDELLKVELEFAEKVQLTLEQVLMCIYTCPLLAILMDSSPPPLSELKVMSGLSTPSGSKKF